MVIESTTPLGISATFDGASYQLNVAPRVSPGGLWAPRVFLRVFVSADEAGTLNVQESPDGKTWYTTTTHAVSASTPAELEALWTLPYIRVQYVNGAILQTVFLLATQLVVQASENA